MKRHEKALGPSIRKGDVEFDEEYLEHTIRQVEDEAIFRDRILFNPCRFLPESSRSRDESLDNRYHWNILTHSRNGLEMSQNVVMHSLTNVSLLLLLTSLTSQSKSAQYRAPYNTGTHISAAKPSRFHPWHEFDESIEPAHVGLCNGFRCCFCSQFLLVVSARHGHRARGVMTWIGSEEP